MVFGSGQNIGYLQPHAAHFSWKCCCQSCGEITITLPISILRGRYWNIFLFLPLRIKWSRAIFVRWLRTLSTLMRRWVTHGLSKLLMLPFAFPSKSHKIVQYYLVLFYYLIIKIPLGFSQHPMYKKCFIVLLTKKRWCIVHKKFWDTNSC